MKPDQMKETLEKFKAGTLSIEEAVEALNHGSCEEDLGFAVLDHSRTQRRGQPEVVFGSGKSAEQIATILERIQTRGDNAMATRVDEKKGAQVRLKLSSAVYHPEARILTYDAHPVEVRGKGTIAVVCAGTSDLPVAEEAAVTAEQFGNHVVRISDVGVAGLHRLLHRVETLRTSRVLIVVAGMEGALPSVIAGLVDRPVIAVPTSVGYGASFGGLSALLAMLNACASGVTVVNIDNGFGAAYAASLINRS